MSEWLIATGDVAVSGGMDRANYALAAYLAARGDTVHLAAHHVAPELARESTVVVHHAARPFGAHLLGAPLLARAAAQAHRRLPPGAPALMNGGNGILGVPTWIHYLHAAYRPGGIRAWRTRLSSAAGRRYYLAREAAAVGAAPLIVCNSRRTADDVRQHYGVAPEKVAVIYYGIDSSAFSPVSDDERRRARLALGVADDRPVALFIGALGDRRKGFDLLFDAWQAMAAQGGWTAELVAAGAGAEREAWAARARDAGLSGVRLLGFRSDVPQLLAAADVLVHPARYEAYGLGVHEAVARGVPVIVPGSAGVAERFPPELAPLVLPRAASAADVAAALGRWAADPAGWRARVATLSTAFRARTWDDMAADIAEAVEAA